MKNRIHLTMKTNLLSATVAALLVSLIAFSMMARAQDTPSIRQQDFEDSTQWVHLPTGYNWVEKGGVSDSACIVIERENKSDYGTLGFIKLINPEPGTYRVSADMKVEEFGDGGASGCVYIDLYQESEYVSIKPNSFSSGPTGGAWVKVEGEVVIPEGITHGWVGAIIPEGSTGKVSVDNLVFQKVQ
jgi:hypothetical protein